MIVNVLFWIFMLVMDLLLPGLMIGFGKSFMKHPPTEINPGYGYRTTMSSKNQDTWDFAQRYMGKVWYQAGRWLLIPSALPLLFVLGRDVGTTGKGGMIPPLSFQTVYVGARSARPRADNVRPYNAMTET